MHQIKMKYILIGLILYFIGKKQDILALQYMGAFTALGLGLGLFLESTQKKLDL